MRIGLSLLTLSPGISGGSETYARGLTRALVSQGSFAYVAIVPESTVGAAGGLPEIVVRDPFVAGRGPTRIPVRALAARLSRDVRDELAALDIVHYPLTVPIPGTQAPTVVTLHDVQHLDLPMLFDAGRRLFRKLAYDRSAQTAAAVIVPSEFVRRRAVELLELDAERVHVVPLAVDRELFRGGEGGREPLLLYPARAWPHKNHRRLLEAFTILRRSHPDLELVLTGEGLEALEPLPPGVERRGYVGVEELAELYRRASCLVFPSLYEGFCLPLLEAMACGCPVAASDVAAIPEICDGAAVLFDPSEPDAIAEGIVKALVRADELRSLGYVRAASFSWAETARHHELVYRSAAEARVRG